MKYLRLHNISIHINIYQNRFINECARMIKAKIPESQSLRVFFVRCRITYMFLIIGNLGAAILFLPSVL